MLSDGSSRKSSLNWLNRKDFLLYIYWKVQNSFQQRGEGLLSHLSVLWAQTSLAAASAVFER